MNYICIFSKPPIPGRTKTRLAKAIGAEAAATLARAMLQDLCEVVLQVEYAVPQLWYPPHTHPRDFNNAIPTPFTFHQQCGNDLGERMFQTFSQLLREDSRNRVIIIGGDCITHTAGALYMGFSDLDRYDVIVQPADDGGYVLIGQSHCCADIFKDINWGNKDVYGKTIERLRRAEISYKQLPSTFDVDCVDDLRKIRLFIEKHKRPNTSTWIKQSDWV